MLATKIPGPKVIELNAKNTIFLNAPVMAGSVAFVMQALRKLDQILPAGEPIYLILDTPGGSVVDGMNIVNVAQSLNRPVHTITIFAASMGFVLVQHLGTRYILQNGVLMSHRGKVGVRGEIGGELDEMVRFFREINETIDQACADRLGMSLKKYQERIADEWWMYGKKAIDAKAADEVVVLTCDKELLAENACPF